MSASNQLNLFSFSLASPAASSAACRVVASVCASPACPHRRENIELRLQANYWQAQFQRAKERFAAKDERIRQLEAEIKKLKQDLFGRKSEKSGALETGAATSAAASTRSRGHQPGSKGHGRRDHSHLPVVEEVREIPLDDRYCQQCGLPTFSEEMGSEDSEILEIEVKAHRRKCCRKKYRRTCACVGQPRIITAPPAPRLIPKTNLGVSIWVMILLDKFQSMRPTYRLLTQLKLYGLDIAQGTITDGLKRITPLLEPVYEAMVERNRQADHWHADETRWQVFVEIPGKTGQRHYLWVFAATDTVVFALHQTRSAKVPTAHFGPQVNGILNVDRYAAYKALRKLGLNLILAYCWAHVRRDFLKLAKSWPAQHNWAMLWVKAIGRLYHLNNARLEVLEQPDAWLKRHNRLTLALTRMNRRCQRELASPNLHPARRKVLTSLQEHWEGLVVFRDHPAIPMDNNLAERTLRPAVIGRKNFYGAGAEWSGKLMAMMLSILATLGLSLINPRQWLTDYLTACAKNDRQPPTDLTPFLPWKDKETPRVLPAPNNSS